jgi:hypothetical protein
MVFRSLSFLFTFFWLIGPIEFDTHKPAIGRKDILKHKSDGVNVKVRVKETDNLMILKKEL